MAYHEQSRRGPDGTMKLQFVHSESASGHRDFYETAWLKPDGEKLVLLVEKRDCKAIQATEDKSVETYSIHPDALISFIKKHGTRS